MHSCFLWQLLHNDYTVDTGLSFIQEPVHTSQKTLFAYEQSLQAKRSAGRLQSIQNILYPNNNTKQKALLRFYVNNGYPKAQQY